MVNEPFRFDLTETFPHLDRAPIVEAVIYWQARTTKVVDPDKLKALLPGYN